MLSYYCSYSDIYSLQKDQQIREQLAEIARLRQALAFSEAARQPAGEQQEQEQERPEVQEVQPSTRGRKRSSWGELEHQGKKVCTASIQAEVEQLAEERGCRPQTILANVMHR